MALLTSPHPQTPHSSVSTTAVNGTIWAHAQNLTPNLLISSLVFLQITFRTWLLLTASHSHPCLSLVILTRQLGEAPISSAFALASLQLFSTPQAERSSRIINLIMSHSCSKSILAFHHPHKISTLGSTQTLPLAPGSSPTPYFALTMSTPTSGPLHLLPLLEGISLDSSFNSNVTASKRPPWSTIKNNTFWPLLCFFFPLPAFTTNQSHATYLLFHLCISVSSIRMSGMWPWILGQGHSLPIHHLDHMSNTYSVLNK